MYSWKKYYDRLYATHLQDTDSIAPEKLNDERAVVMADAHRVPIYRSAGLESDCPLGGKSSNRSSCGILR